MSGPVINVSENALKQIATLIEIEGDPNLRLRVYITGGGCAGFQYGFAFETEQREDDFVCTTISKNGDKQIKVEVIVDPMSMMYLNGAQVDYIENLRGRHFTVTNPNAATTCSCGSSFGIEGND